MHVTFLIGNGFDLNLELKTKYKDIYATYCQTPSASNTIKWFKENLNNHYENWADFEMGMVEYAKNFKSEADFLECVRDFRKHMVLHLKRQEARFDACWEMEEWKTVAMRAFEKSMTQFFSNSTPNLSKMFQNVMKKEACFYNFINFNYTTVLDKLVKVADGKSSSKQIYTSPIHIHGSLDNNPILGVDNEKQFQGLSFELSNRIRRTFIKPYFNNAYDSSRIEDATQKILRSDIICSFGFSFGESDLTWREAIIRWLYQSENNILINYPFWEKKYDSNEMDVVMDDEEMQKILFCDMLKMSSEQIEKFWKQIYIPLSVKIFDLPPVFTLEDESDDLQKSESA